MSAQPRELDLFLKRESDQLVLKTYFDSNAHPTQEGFELANEDDVVPVTPERLAQIKALVQDESTLHVHREDVLGTASFWVEPEPGTKIYILDDELVDQLRANNI